MIKNGKIFGKINIVDFTLIVFVLIAILGFVLVKTNKHITSENIIEKQANIEFDVVLRGKKVSRKEAIFKKGDKTFITLRNVPYTSLEIASIERTHWKAIIPDAFAPGGAFAIEDSTAPYTYNFLITLKDKAKITKDGAVIGGNKIKIGLPIVLEGFDYKLCGSVSDVRIKE